MNKRLSLFLLLISVGLLTALAAGPVFSAGSVGGGAEELRGLHEAAHIPVGSISSRGDYPDHPVADPGNSKRKGLRGLREAPNLPVRSIPLRRAHPSHPVGPPGEQTAGSCDDVDLTNTISDGVVNVAAQDNGIYGNCTNADIDTYFRESDSTTYVVQAGGEEAAWTHTDVSDPRNPDLLAQYYWDDGSRRNRMGEATYTPDLKTFKQGPNDYIVMGLERTALRAYCGVIIVNVTNPVDTMIESQFIGTDWCDSHNVFVEDDPITGDGQFIYAVADATKDLRVLDIKAVGSVSNPVELGKYRRTVRGYGSNIYEDILVHDVTVDGGIAYVSYWKAGLDFFPASLIQVAGAVINESHGSVTNITPSAFATDTPFLVHHAFPSGNYVFLEDEVTYDEDANGDPITGVEPVQMFDTRTSPPTYVDGLVLGTDVPVIPAHNLEINDIDPDRLYVGWYQAGLQAWDFTSAGFARPGTTSQRTAVLYHQVQTEPTDGVYSGAWAVRLENITTASGTNLYIFQSDRNFGLIVDCVGCVVSPATAPDAPSGLSATAMSSSQINLTWTDNSSNENMFSVERSDDEGATFSQIATVGANVEDYSDTGLAPSATHYYRVMASNEVDDSIYSNSDSATTAAAGGGTAPSVTACDPDMGNRGDRFTVKVFGTDFQNGATADFGARVTVQNVTVDSSTQLRVQIKIHNRADPGFRNVTVENLDGLTGTGFGCFSVNGP